MLGDSDERKADRRPSATVTPPNEGMHLVQVSDQGVDLDGRRLRGVTSYELKKSGPDGPAELMVKLQVRVGSEA